VRGLPTRDGDVFLRRYFFTESIAEIAAEYGLSQGNVSVILTRTRKKLRDYLEQEQLL
jgi:RNA polymerase sigma-70 factor (ECF subfamily)